MKQLTTVLTIAAIALLSGTAFAQLDIAILDDFEDGDGTNLFGGKWKFGNDHWAPEGQEGGNSQVLSAKNPDAQWLEYAGDYGGGYGGSAEACLLRYRLGDRPDPWGHNKVSVKTSLTPSEYGELDISSSAGIIFHAKASQQTTIRVEIATGNVTDFAYNYTDISVGTEWQLYELQWSSFQKPDYTQNENALDLSRAQYVSWKISKGTNTSIDPSFSMEGELWLDDVKIAGYDFVPGCVACVSEPGTPPEPAALVIDFEWEAPLELTNELGKGSWGEAIQDPTGAAEPTTLANGGVQTSGVGYDGTDGVMMEFILGEGWKYEGTYDAKPKVKYVVELHSEDSAAASQGSRGVYFDYKTTGDADRVKFEIGTVKIYQQSEIAYPSAIVPGTEGEWKGAFIPWDTLAMPNWGKPADEFDASGIRELSFTVEGSKGDAGSIALDNIHIVGVDTLTLAPKANLLPARGIAGGGPNASPLRVARIGDKLHVSLNAARPPVAATAAIYDCRGRMALRTPLSRPATRGGWIMGIEPLEAAGRYTLVVRTRDARGRRASFTRSLTTVR
jgi:hypothetical protein